jgi:ApaG protein
MSSTITEGIRIQVRAAWWPERSNPDGGQWAFTYTITITNEGPVQATLRSRHWIITDATGHVEEVRGEGVVGQQPTLGEGESFEYTSWAMLRTPFGSMTGEYLMERADGATFEARISTFSLSQPHSLH